MATPPEIERACRRVADPAPLCPARLPRPVEEIDLEGGGDFEPGEDGWLLGLLLGFEAPAFHVLIGGREAPFSLTDDRGAWPAADERPGLSLTNAPAREFDDPEKAAPLARPWVWARTTVNDTPALMLGWGPFPTSGTVHGGHQGLIWNASGDGYAITAHFQPDIPPDRRLATLRAVAESFHPAR